MLAFAVSLGCAHRSKFPCPSVAAGRAIDQLDAPPPTAATLPTRVRDCMDCRSDPCQDFHQYACGGWIGALETEGSTAATGLIEVARHHDRTMEEAFRGLVQAGASTPAATFFMACLDPQARASAGTEAIAPLLAAIDGVTDASSFASVAGMLATHGITGPLRFVVVPGEDGNAMLQIGLQRRGERPQFAAPDLAATRDAYVTAMTVLGESKALAVRRAEAALAFERALPVGTKGRVQQTTTVAELAQNPALAQLHALLQAAGLDAGARVRFDEADLVAMFAAVDQLAEPLVLQAYLRARVIDAVAPYTARLDGAWEGLYHAVADRVPSRDEVCRELTGEVFPGEVDAAFLARAFDPATATLARGMIDGTRAALDRRLPSIPWMPAAASQRAQARLARLHVGVGHPEQWPRDLTRASGRPLDDALAHREAKWRRELDGLGRPLASTWTVVAHDLNAYFEPLSHGLSFPAAILQPPLFGRDYPVAYDYGAMGSIAGHELTHALDLRWWLAGPVEELPGPEVVEARREAEACVVADYDRRMTEAPFAGRGAAVAAEAMADIGGVHFAHAALADAKPDARTIRGLSSEQLFFVAYAQSMCMHPMMDELLAKGGDVHPPSAYRVNGVLAQLPEFAAAFACEPGTPMAPADRCESW